MAPRPTRDCLVVGASAGGLDATSSLLVQLDAGFPAAILVVLHVAAEAEGRHAALLDRASPLPVALAEDGEPLRRGHVYVAPPDHHLFVDPPTAPGAVGRAGVVRGPKENRVRPAIDPLFRSAAVVCGSGAMGVLLSGLLDDGVAGLDAIQRCGGVAIVQEPGDAAYPDLPRNALAHLAPDHVVPVHRMGGLLRELAAAAPRAAVAVPDDVVMETRIAKRAESNVAADDRIGTPAPYGCPECGGPLWQMDDAVPKRYRCHVGHGYTARTLLAEQEEQTERALWAALRTLEERAHLLEEMAAGADPRTGLSQRAADARQHADHLRGLLLGGGDPATGTAAPGASGNGAHAGGEAPR
ncbi:MAG: chemotaxis protein CheB [Rubricoccaceae bacterium]|nr:chemotaxis protein CheB [Rubricoccaceae bacterium]